ncbi:30S ribosomal protein S16 [Celeribacter baekdonensis]|uniref:Small ribosomal subunit protein bS16 n=1 Tax=Celeribacter baekdonensis TaxID=875171 RepID=A0A2R4M7A2_9RHOB|nr:30S ribosomal protein S16 [Celeribacter baekdonensis]AVW92998.1 30S ribosomal protein S16 [Celeribacter baekdonensis]
MAVKLRLARRGAKKRPFYWIVSADSRSPRDGKFIEKLGTYDPMLKPSNRVELDLDRVSFWLECGAQPTDRVARILADAGLIKKKQRFNPQKGAPKKRAQEKGGEIRANPFVKQAELTDAELQGIKSTLAGLVR